MPVTPASALIAIRTAVGLSAYVTPDLAGRLFGLDPAANPQSRYLARLFGVRDVVMAVGLQGASGQARRRWLSLGVAADAADVLSAYLGHRDRTLSPTTAVLAGGTAALATACGIAALSSE